MICKWISTGNDFKGGLKDLPQRYVRVRRSILSMQRKGRKGRGSAEGREFQSIAAGQTFHTEKSTTKKPAVV